MTSQRSLHSSVELNHGAKQLSEWCFFALYWCSVNVIKAQGKIGAAEDAWNSFLGAEKEGLWLPSEPAMANSALNAAAEQGYELALEK